LWQSNEINITRAIAVGWGYTEYGGGTSDILMKVALEFAKKQKCESTILTHGKTMYDTQICAGGVGDRDTCMGDSGGSLGILLEDCIHHVIGLTSFGSSYCGFSEPGIYTKVASYLDWIESIVWPQ
jgi:serine protease immune response integrator